MALPRRALARINNESNTKTTSVRFEIGGQPSADPVCNDTAESSINICNTAGGTDKDNNGALQPITSTENGPTNRFFPVQSQEDLGHQGDEETRDGLQPTREQPDEPSSSSTATLDHDENIMNDAPLFSAKDDKLEVRDGNKKMHGEEAAVPKPHCATSVTREVGPVTNAEPEIEIVSKPVEREEGASNQDEMEASPSQSGGALRRSQRVRRPTQRYAAGMGNADSGKRKRGKMDNDEYQEAMEGQGHSKRKRNDAREAGEDSPENGADPARCTRRRTEGPSSTNYSVREYQIARISQTEVDRRAKRWRVFVDVVSRAEYIEVA